MPRLVIVWQCLNPECTTAKKSLLRTADRYTLSYYGMELDSKKKRKVTYYKIKLLKAD